LRQSWQIGQSPVAAPQHPPLQQPPPQPAPHPQLGSQPHSPQQPVSHVAQQLSGQWLPVQEYGSSQPQPY
jgi:hypothetical protein